MSRFREPVFALFRVVVGVMFGLHGFTSLTGVLGGVRGTGEAVALGLWPGWWAALIQFVGGVLVAVGLGTRGAALVCSGSMAYAYFVVHQPDALVPTANGGELAALFCWAFFLIAVSGRTRWSVDTLLWSDQQSGT